MNRAPTYADEVMPLDIPNDDELDALCDQLMRFDGEADPAPATEKPKTSAPVVFSL